MTYGVYVPIYPHRGISETNWIEQAILNNKLNAS